MYSGTSEKGTLWGNGLCPWKPSLKQLGPTFKRKWHEIALGSKWCLYVNTNGQLASWWVPWLMLMVWYIYTGRTRSFSLWTRVVLPKTSPWEIARYHMHMPIIFLSQGSYCGYTCMDYKLHAQTMSWVSGVLSAIYAWSLLEAPQPQLWAACCWTDHVMYNNYF